MSCSRNQSSSCLWCSCYGFHMNPCFNCITNYLSICYEVDFYMMLGPYTAILLWIYCFVGLKIERNSKRVWTIVGSTLTKDPNVHLSSHSFLILVSWLCGMLFFTVDDPHFARVLTQNCRGLCPSTEWAIPPGTTILLFLVWGQQYCCS